MKKFTVYVEIMAEAGNEVDAMAQAIKGLFDYGIDYRIVSTVEESE